MKTFAIFMMFLAPLMTLCKGGDSKEVFHRIDKEQAEMAFKYLNHVRKLPDEYGERMGVDLSGVEPRRPLEWHETLAQVAEEKALDMARRDYLSQVDPEGRGINILMHEAGYKLPPEWIEDERLNYFGIVQGGARDGVDIIKSLLTAENNVANKRMLLGTDDFSKDMEHVGIGFVRSYKSTFRTYSCIIVAKQNP